MKSQDHKYIIDNEEDINDTLDDTSVPPIFQSTIVDPLDTMINNNKNGDHHSPQGSIVRLPLLA